MLQEISLGKKKASGNNYIDLQPFKRSLEGDQERQ